MQSWRNNHEGAENQEASRQMGREIFSKMHLLVSMDDKCGRCRARCPERRNARTPKQVQILRRHLTTGKPAKGTDRMDIARHGVNNVVAAVGSHR
jgi:hypothetical protein